MFIMFCVEFNSESADIVHEVLSIEGPDINSEDYMRHMRLNYSP